jgi:hypothetical protein
MQKISALTLSALLVAAAAAQALLPWRPPPDTDQAKKGDRDEFPGRRQGGGGWGFRSQLRQALEISKSEGLRSALRRLNSSESPLGDRKG